MKGFLLRKGIMNEFKRRERGGGEEYCFPGKKRGKGRGDIAFSGIAKPVYVPARSSGLRGGKKGRGGYGRAPGSLGKE